jgi:hypothetical protein
MPKESLNLRSILNRYGSDYAWREDLVRWIFCDESQDNLTMRVQIGGALWEWTVKFVRSPNKVILFGQLHWYVRFGWMFSSNSAINSRFHNISPSRPDSNEGRDKHRIEKLSENSLKFDDSIVETVRRVGWLFVESRISEKISEISQMSAISRS